MNLLIDTHAIIWFITDSQNLPPSIKLMLENKENNCYVSIASLWEIAIKHSLEILKLNSNLENVFKTIEESGFECLPISVRHILQNSQLAFHHQDPFDRIIIAQAMVDDLKIITKDGQFHKYDVSMIWNDM